MGKHVVHHFDVDFDNLRDGERFESLCGMRFIAGPQPTPEQRAEIEERTRDVPDCSACLKRRKGRKGK